MSEIQANDQTAAQSGAARPDTPQSGAARPGAAQPDATQPHTAKPHANESGALGPHHHFSAFVDTIATLRAPDGCPWDRAQTHESIASNMIEEAYEAVDAIEAKDSVHLREELGDVLLQVVLQSQIAADAGAFTIDDVCADVNAKMIRRHPHVFSDAQASSAADVLDLWEQVKLGEKDVSQTDPSATPAAAPSAQDAQAHKSLLDSVPTSFPALMQAQKLSRKAAAVGFDWETLTDIWEKVREEVSELEEAYAVAPQAANGKIDAAAGVSPLSFDAATEAVLAVEQEFGDVLFSLVNVARRMGIDSEHALRTTCSKFRRRWTYMEISAAKQGLRIEDVSAAEQERFWDQAKVQERL